MPESAASGRTEAAPFREGAASLSARIARADPKALEDFYNAWFPWVVALGRALTGRDESFCLDTAQEVFLRVARSMRAMRSDEDVRRWMTRVTHTAALDLLRREARSAAHGRAGRGNAAPAPDPVTDSELRERIAWLVKRMKDLPSEDRWLVLLRFGRGRSLEQTGADAGLTGDAAHGRIRRTLSRLRETGAMEVPDER